MTSTQRAQLVAALIALCGFAVVVQQVMTNGWLIDADKSLALRYSHGLAGRVHSIRRLQGSGRLVTIARYFTPFGDVGLLFAVIGAVGFLLYLRNRRREAGFVVVAAVGGVFIDLVTRTIIGQVRPDLPIPGFIVLRDGLPSGHAMDATVCYGALLVVVWVGRSRWQRVGATVALMGLALAVSYSRVVTLAHYFSDVVAGVTLGLAWLLALTAAFSLPTRDRLPPAP